MVAAQSYSLLFPEEPGLARIAVCAEFNAAMQAKDDGCDAALIYNAQTQQWFDWLTEYTASENPVLLECVRQGMTAMTGHRPDIDQTKIRGGANFHTDSSGVVADDVLNGLITTVPTTVIALQRAMWPDDDWSCIKIPGSKATIPIRYIEDCRHATLISPLPGRLLLMFKQDGYYNLVHSQSYLLNKNGSLVVGADQVMVPHIRTRAFA